MVRDALYYYKLAANPVQAESLFYMGGCYKHGMGVT